MSPTLKAAALPLDHWGGAVRGVLGSQQWHHCILHQPGHWDRKCLPLLRWPEHEGWGRSRGSSWGSGWWLRTGSSCPPPACSTWTGVWLHALSAPRWLCSVGTTSKFLSISQEQCTHSIWIFARHYNPLTGISEGSLFHFWGSIKHSLKRKLYILHRITVNNTVTCKAQWFEYIPFDKTMSTTIHS